MGIDFIRKQRAGHRKAWREQAMLKTADLFLTSGSKPKRTFRAVTCSGTQLQAGQRLLLRRTDDGVVACEGTRSLAHVPNPSADLLSVLDRCHGVAIATVDTSLADVGLADLSIGD